MISLNAKIVSFICFLILSLNYMTQQSYQQDYRVSLKRVITAQQVSNRIPKQDQSSSKPLVYSEPSSSELT